MRERRVVKDAEDLYKHPLAQNAYTCYSLVIIFGLCNWSHPFGLKQWGVPFLAELGGVYDVERKSGLVRYLLEW